MLFLNGFRYFPGRSSSRSRFAGGQDRSKPNLTLNMCAVRLPGIVLSVYFLDRSSIKKVTCTFTGSTPKERDRMLLASALREISISGLFSSSALAEVKSNRCVLSKQLRLIALNM